MNDKAHTNTNTNAAANTQPVIDAIPLTRGKFARAIGKSMSTLKRHEASGVTKPRRDAAGKAYYLPEDVIAFLNPVK